MKNLQFYGDFCQKSKDVLKYRRLMLIFSYISVDK
jgi:hypothetical protein